MIRQIAPQFFTTDIPATLAYYKNNSASNVSDVAGPSGLRDRGARRTCDSLPLRRTAHANPDKYADELLDAYLFVEDADALMPSTQRVAWNSRGDSPTCHGTRASL